MSADETALKFANWITTKAVDGIPPLTPARELVLEYNRHTRYTTPEERTAALISAEIKKNFASGFLTGLPGILTMPVAIPSAFAASWVLQARLSAAVAGIHGHNVDSEQTRTLVLLTLVGDAADEVLRDAGSKIGIKACRSAFARIPGRVLNQINTRVGHFLLRIAAGRGAVLVARAVPLLGGVIAGTYDAYTCRAVGRQAQRIFSTLPAKPTRRKPAAKKPRRAKAVA